MKFPSVKYLTSQAAASFKRFYLPLIFAFIGTYVALLQVESSSYPFTRVLFSCLIALSLSLGGMLYAERSGKQIIKWLSVPLAVVYWYWLAPEAFFDDTRPTLIFFVLALVMHLWVAISPYIQSKERIGFWRFNETLYARMFQSLLFSVAIYIGLTLAIFACRELLKIDLGTYIYIRLWIIIAGVFNTWFFLAGIPADYEELNTEKQFPKLLKIFTQYILMPLVTLYMLILYAYGLKIMAQWTLPKGWVSMLILWYAIVGILAVLLVSPLRDNKDTPWVRFFSKFFFIASLPLIVLLYISIAVRVSNYGVTESRYYLILMGSWLGFISLYFIFSKQKNIKLIPVSLVIVGLLSLFGPWSAFAVSKRSQLHCFEAILIKNNIWKPGEKITTSKKNINSRDAERLSSIIDYFIDRKEITTLQPVYAIDLTALAQTQYTSYKNDRYENNWEKRNLLKTKLSGILFLQDNNTNTITAYNPDMAFTADTHIGMDISGFSKALDYNYNSYSEEKRWIFLSQNDSLQVILTQKDSLISIDLLRNEKAIESIDLNGFIKKLRDSTTNHYMPIKQMTIDGVGAIKPRIIIKSIMIEGEGALNDNKTIRQLDGWILIR